MTTLPPSAPTVAAPEATPARALRSVWFVRHGESTANAGGMTLAHADIPLTERGLRHAQALVDWLPATPGQLLCSPFHRARQTAQPYATRVRMAPTPHTLLHEFDAIDPALLAGMDGSQRRPVADAFWARGNAHERMGQAAETFAEFAGRVHTFMLTTLPGLPDQSVAFGHGQWMGMLAWLLLGFEPLADGGMARFRRFTQGLPMPNGAIYIAQELAPGQWRLQAHAPAMHGLAALG
ncbi:hypothetical protein CCO03_14660 [Comamonas serinivorans]|uniref:Histidine phosphatase family protein n=1 Tax=Comamonas serinivorans TaxID=1082851 RepID=A0A1Y0EQQ8_9BURK|nr:histidine phosphatase family protein [Comamonas serinivorans]ARU05760.1 hypothetical protein CCO03_14660 [Comamonas serinivorans]